MAGYEIERGEHGQPEIKGYTREYLEASSPRQAQITSELKEIGREGAGAAQVVAHRSRDFKEIQSAADVLHRHASSPPSTGTKLIGWYRVRWQTIAASRSTRRRSRIRP